jgi:hypothetical protein
MTKPVITETLLKAATERSEAFVKKLRNMTINELAEIAEHCSITNKKYVWAGVVITLNGQAFRSGKWSVSPSVISVDIELEKIVRDEVDMNELRNAFIQAFGYEVARHNLKTEDLVSVSSEELEKASLADAEGQCFEDNDSAQVIANSGFAVGVSALIWREFNVRKEMTPHEKVDQIRKAGLQKGETAFAKIVKRLVEIEREYQETQAVLAHSA